MIDFFLCASFFTLLFVWTKTTEAELTDLLKERKIFQIVDQFFREDKTDEDSDQDGFFTNLFNDSPSKRNEEEKLFIDFLRRPGIEFHYPVLPVADVYI